MYWFIAAVAVFVLEMFAGTLYLLIIAAALCGAGLASLLVGGQTVPVLTAAALAALGLFWLYRRLKTRKRTAGGNDLDIGHDVEILHGEADGRCRVRYRGTVWQARTADGSPAGKGSARISGKDGNTLIIAKD